MTTSNSSAQSFVADTITHATEEAANTLSFEAALAELETLVRKLEEGRMPLDESIKTYERGIFLKNYCDGQLKSAQLKIEEVMVSAEAK